MSNPSSNQPTQNQNHPSTQHRRLPIRQSGNQNDRNAQNLRLPNSNQSTQYSSYPNGPNQHLQIPDPNQFTQNPSYPHISQLDRPVQQVNNLYEISNPNFNPPTAHPSHLSNLQQNRTVPYQNNTPMISNPSPNQPTLQNLNDPHNFRQLHPIPHTPNQEIMFDAYLTDQGLYREKDVDSLTYKYKPGPSTAFPKVWGPGIP